MPSVNPSTYMSLPVPEVGVEPGPQWATDLNNCLTIVDYHDHSSGLGVQVTPSGLDINADLTYSNNNATSLRSIRFQTQASPLALAPDVGCLYESGVDLYYNDGSGNQIRITQSGGVVGTPGSITGLVSPASATYVPASQKFVWQQAVNTAANMDFASAILRNTSVSSFGCTLNPPAAMGADIALTLPTIPSSQKIVTLDNAGQFSAPYVVDNASIEISSNTIQVKALGIVTSMINNLAVTTAKIDNLAVTTGKIALGAVTDATAGALTTAALSASAGILKSQLAALGQQTSAGCGTYTTTSGTNVTVTNLSVTITTSGRPVFVGMMCDGSSVANGVYMSVAGQGFVSIFRDATFLANEQVDSSTTVIPNSSLWVIDAVAAGTYTYTIQARRNSGTLAIDNAMLMAYEL